MSSNREASSWAVGWMVYAAVWMWIAGFFHALAGFVALVENQIIINSPDYPFQLTVTTWGWIHLILGIVIILAGFAVFNGSIWARTVGVLLAAVSTISSFMWLPNYPLWGVLIIGANVFVIWALTVHGRDAAAG